MSWNYQVMNMDYLAWKYNSITSFKFCRKSVFQKFIFQLTWALNMNTAT